MIRIARRRASTILALAVTAVLGASLSLAVSAQQPPEGDFKPRFGQPPAFPDSGGEEYGDSRDRVAVSAFAAQDKVAPGSDVVIAIVLDHQPGWHTWPNAGNVPQGMAEFSGAINTVITAKASGPNAADVQVHDAYMQWPAVHAARADVGEGPQDYATFSDRAIVYLPVTVKPDARPGSVTIDITDSFQTCNDTTCLAPAEAVVPVTLQVVDAATLAASPAAKNHQADFAGFDPSAWAKIHGGAADGGLRSNPVAPVVGGDGSAVPRPTFFGVTLPRTEGALGIAVLVLLSMLGGLILNLTPCVLPIIPIKILTISQHAGSPGRTFMLGLWMALGVVAFWAGIGVPAALFTSAADPSRLFGIWWLTLAIGLLIGAMGIGIMGLFTIQLPAAVYAVNPKADSPWGSFLFGVMTAVLGLPCFGFVAGALLAGSAALPPLVIAVIFTSIGIGMASPYLVLAARPGLVERIPRTGPASELVKQVMGLLLLAAAAYFVGSGLITLVIDYPHVGKQLHWWVAATCVVAAGLWLTMRTFQITSRATPRVVFAMIGLGLGALAIMFAINRTDVARIEWERTQASALSSDTFVAGAWNDYTPARFAKAREADLIVVLDFTASWCLTCQVLKATVLDPEPVKSAFESKDVVVFSVDLSSLKAPGWELLRSLGKTGIPLLAIYAPGQDRPWDANAYTAGEVLAAMEQARAKRVAIR